MKKRSLLILASLVICLLLPSISSAQINHILYDKDSAIVIKGDKQFVPFEFINEKGEADGFSVDLIKALMKRLNIKYTLSLEDWDQVQEELYNKEIDMAVGMIYSKDRASKVKFGIPHCMISYNIICRKDNDFVRMEDLREKRVAVQNRDRAHGYMLEINLTDKIIPVEKIADAIEMVNDGECDAVISFDFTAFYLVHTGHYTNLRVHMTDIPAEKYSMVVNTDNEDLLYMLNSALYQMKVDGEYDKIHYKWFGVYVHNKIYKTVWYILIGLGAFLIIATCFVLLLNHRVHIATTVLQQKNDELRQENLRRMEIEDKLIKARDKAEESDRLKSAFLESLSHEIRTPLNAIIGFSSLMIDTVDEDKRVMFDKIIGTNNKLLLNMINDMIDLSTIESGAVAFANTDFDLAELCHNALESTRSIDKSQIHFIEDYQFNCTMHADKTRLFKIISNFMTNAIKFTEKGSITLGTSAYGTDGVEVRIFVKDTGVGVPSDKLEAIFDKFVKLDTFKQGTGIGLTIVKQIAEYMGGKIGVKSTYGEGSEFWVVIPINQSIL